MNLDEHLKTVLGNNKIYKIWDFNLRTALIELDISSKSRRVYEALLAGCDAEGHAETTDEWIAEYAEIRKRDVSTCRKELVSVGLLVINRLGKRVPVRANGVLSWAGIGTKYTVICAVRKATNFDSLMSNSVSDPESDLSHLIQNHVSDYVSNDASMSDSMSGNVSDSVSVLSYPIQNHVSSDVTFDTPYTKTCQAPCHLGTDKNTSNTSNTVIDNTVIDNTSNTVIDNTKDEVLHTKNEVDQDIVVSNNAPLHKNEGSNAPLHKNEGCYAPINIPVSNLDERTLYDILREPDWSVRYKKLSKYLENFIGRQLSQNEFKYMVSICKNLSCPRVNLSSASIYACCFNEFICSLATDNIDFKPEHYSYNNHPHKDLIHDVLHSNGYNGVPKDLNEWIKQSTADEVLDVFTKLKTRTTQEIKVRIDSVCFWDL